MINIVDKKDCCSCNACGDHCPTNPITFKTDVEVFLFKKLITGIQKEIKT